MPGTDRTDEHRLAYDPTHDFLTIEIMIGDVENAEFADDSTFDATDAALALERLRLKFSELEAEVAELKGLLHRARVLIEKETVLWRKRPKRASAADHR